MASEIVIVVCDAKTEYKCQSGFGLGNVGDFN